MKTKMLLMAALISGATLSAQAGVSFGLSIGFPLPTAVVVAPPVAPVVVAPVAPVAVVAAPAAPACIWVPGYWSVGAYGRVWVPGCWHHQPAHTVYAHSPGWRR